MVAAGFLEMLVQYLPTNYMVSSQTIMSDIFLLFFVSHTLILTFKCSVAEIENDALCDENDQEIC